MAADRTERAARLNIGVVTSTDATLQQPDETYDIRLMPHPKVARPW